MSWPTEVTLHTPTPADVVEVVAQHCGFSVEEIRGPSNERPLIHYRAVAITACRLVTGWSYATLGRFFGGRTAPALIKTVRRVESEPQAQAMAEEVAELSKSSKGRTQDVPLATNRPHELQRCRSSKGSAADVPH